MSEFGNRLAQNAVLLLSPVVIFTYVDYLHGESLSIMDGVPIQYWHVDMLHAAPVAFVVLVSVTIAFLTLGNFRDRTINTGSVPSPSAQGMLLRFSIAASLGSVLFSTLLMLRTTPLQALLTSFVLAVLFFTSMSLATLSSTMRAKIARIPIIFRLAALPVFRPLLRPYRGRNRLIDAASADWLMRHKLIVAVAAGSMALTAFGFLWGWQDEQTPNVNLVLTPSLEIVMRWTGNEIVTAPFDPRTLTVTRRWTLRHLDDTRQHYSIWPVVLPQPITRYVADPLLAQIIIEGGKPVTRSWQRAAEVRRFGHGL